MVFMGMMSFSNLVYAQFEGQVTIQFYSEKDGVSQSSEMNLYSTSNRIILKGNNSVSVMDGFDASGLLIRNDKKDFVVMLGENKALQFTKEEMEGLFNMIGMMGDNEKESQDVDSNTKFTYTNKTRKIMGYETTELLIENTDENDTSLSLWLTSGIDINWGMLAEPWNNVPVGMKNSVSKMSQEFKSRNFPLLIEVLSKEGTSKVMEVTNVNKSSVAKAMVEVPAGVSLVGLQEVIFSMMMGN